ncbi:MAG: SufS family cysteine desulfurase [Planctomycetaceae bacterium]
MEEITPEFIARMASRIYNESQPASPSSSMASPQAVAESMPPAGMPANPQAPSMPYQGVTMPSAPAASPIAMGELPALPVAPSMASPSAPRGLPQFPLNSSPPSLPTGLGSFPVPSGQSVPPSSIAPAAGDGLRAFVQNIRSTNTVGSDFCAPLTLGLQQPSRGVNAFQSPVGSRPFDVQAIRKDFPVLHQKVNGKPLVWLDNAATTQKPQVVIDAISHFYENDNSNIHRAAHTLAARATDAYEKARSKIQNFLGAASPKEIVYVRGTTEGVNIIAQTYGRKFLQPGDEIVLSTLEHHANIVPWQMVAQERGAFIRVIPVNDQGEIMLEEMHRIMGPRTKLVAVTHASNSLGTILPVAEITQIAKRYGARVLIDGAQSVAHIPVNVQQLGCDFYVFSGHKIFGPMGIGAVYIKEELHDILPPWQGGGNMIRNVTFEGTTFSEAPAKFEAGTPNVADAVGLGYALDYVSSLELSKIAAYEHELLVYATERMRRIPGLRLFGNAREKVGVLSFVLPNYKTEEVGKLLDQEGIAVRSGHHCSQPSLRRFGVEATVRPSLSLYNTKSEIDHLVETVQRIQKSR